MQEDIERRTVALSVNAGKLTGRVLAKVLAAAVRKIQKSYREGQTPQGRQSVKKLMNHYGEKSTMPLDCNTRLWDRVARIYEVDYAFRKVGPKKHLLFFKASQASRITDAFSEYAKLVLTRTQTKHPSILAQIKVFSEKSRTKPHVQERKREAARDER